MEEDEKMLHETFSVQPLEYSLKRNYIIHDAG